MKELSVETAVEVLPVLLLSSTCLIILGSFPEFLPATPVDKVDFLLIFLLFVTMLDLQGDALDGDCGKDGNFSLLSAVLGESIFRPAYVPIGTEPVGQMQPRFPLHLLSVHFIILNNTNLSVRRYVQ